MKKLLIASGIFLGVAGHLRAQDSTKPKVPFDDIETSWQNGSDRRDSAVFSGGKFFTPRVLVDINYTHSFNRPNDNTVVGSTALARDNEVQLSQLSFGGEFNYQNARAKFLMQLGTRT